MILDFRKNSHGCFLKINLLPKKFLEISVRGQGGGGERLYLFSTFLLLPKFIILKLPFSQPLVVLFLNSMNKFFRNLTSLFNISLVYRLSEHKWLQQEPTLNTQLFRPIWLNS